MLVHQIAVYQMHKCKRNPFLILSDLSHLFVNIKAIACWRVSIGLSKSTHFYAIFSPHIPQTKRPERHLACLHSKRKLIWCSVVVWKEARQLKKGICRMYTIGLMFANPRALNTDLHLYNAGFGCIMLGPHNECTTFSKERLQSQM